MPMHLDSHQERNAPNGYKLHYNILIHVINAFGTVLIDFNRFLRPFDEEY